MKKYLLPLAFLGSAVTAFASMESDSVTLPEMRAVDTQDKMLVQQTLPEYPYELRRSGVTGRVRLDIVFDRQGKVKAITVLNTENQALATAARKAVQQWKFVPDSTRSEHKHARITFSFELSEPA